MTFQVWWGELRLCVWSSSDMSRQNWPWYQIIKFFVQWCLVLIITVPVLVHRVCVYKGGRSKKTPNFDSLFFFQFLLPLGLESAIDVVISLYSTLFPPSKNRAMIYIPTLAFGVAMLARLSLAAPIQIERRIDQIISDSTKLWQLACVSPQEFYISCRY